MSKGYALITGASEGIGKELARVMASKNHNLILVARRRNLLEELKIEIEKRYSVSVLIFDADLTDEAQIDRLHKSCSAYEVDFLINNAGFGSLGDYAQSDWQKESSMVKLNVLALMQLTRLFLPAMIEKRKGKILNTASIAAFQPGPKMATYFATKAFVVSFSRALSWELRKTGVTVTALCPGPVLTGFQSSAGMQGSRMLKLIKLPTARQVAEFGYNAAIKGKRVAIEGAMNRFLVYLIKFMPMGLVLKLSEKIVEVEK